MNDKQQQSNIIRNICKVYNIQLHDNPSSSSIASLEQTEINDVYLTNRIENEKEQNMSNDVQMKTPSEPAQFEQQLTQKRKSDEKLDSELLSHEIDLSKQKTTRNHRPQRGRK